MKFRLPIPVRRAMSAPLRWVPLRIRSGPNAGRRWSVAAAGRGRWSGRYERERFETLSSLIEPRDCVWDVGAHQGYSALVMVGAVRPSSPVIVFEPSMYNRAYLEQHMAWNRCSNVQVLPFALGDRDGTARFGGTGGSVSQRVGGGSELVTVRSADSLMRDGVPQPTFIKVDIEGAEADMLAGAADALQRVELLMIAVHGHALYERCLAILPRAGFEIYRSVRIRPWLDQSPVPWAGDPDLIAVRPECASRRSAIERLSAFERVPEAHAS